jgi:bifunctional DNA-binding transcriptional regulator/antitoxin component of YhaV-PrlF toxin-antitoxin module
MPIKVVRKIILTGLSSYTIPLPKDWCRYHNLKPGDCVEIIGNSELIVKPLQKSLKSGKNG